jgi:hypothetical protein
MLDHPMRPSPPRFAMDVVSSLRAPRGSHTDHGYVATREAAMAAFLSDSQLLDYILLAMRRLEGQMVRFAWLGLLALIVLSPTPVIAGPAEDANAALDRWSAAYTGNDPDTRRTNLLARCGPSWDSKPDHVGGDGSDPDILFTAEGKRQQKRNY